jgi:DNA-binding HxlR family transcriptional regulator
MSKLREELRKKIREMQESGMSDTEISRIVLKEFLEIINGKIEVIPSDNVYVSILELLANTKHGKTCKQIKKDVNSERILGRLNDLRNFGLVNYKDRRYSLSDKGRELCEYLFSMKMLNLIY